MTRTRTGNKREAIIAASVRAIALDGPSAPTKAIAKEVGIAEGTIFRYFPTKDDLLNSVFLHLKAEFRKAAEDAPDASEGEFLWAEWDRYIDWGIANPDSYKALARLTASDRITADTHARADALFPKLLDICQASANLTLGGSGTLFLNAVYYTLAERVIDFSVKDPSAAAGFKAAGFDMVMAAMGKRWRSEK